ncbi:MAG: DoxX family protein [Balneolaceae bacterium]|nr:DoxX family protein [Balneolaceae bacterium]
MKRTTLLVSWLFQIVAAAIFLQTLYFKFSAAPESVYIFRTVGMEPWGRITTGIAELFAGILLLWPRKAWLGGLLGLIIISGALFFHFTTLGIEVQGDGGTLFYLAITVFASCLLVLLLRWPQAVDDIRTWRNLAGGHEK